MVSNKTILHTFALPALSAIAISLIAIPAQAFQICTVDSNGSCIDGTLSNFYQFTDIGWGYVASDLPITPDPIYPSYSADGHPLNFEWMKYLPKSPPITIYPFKILGVLKLNQYKAPSPTHSVVPTYWLPTPGYTGEIHTDSWKPTYGYSGTGYPTTLAPGASYLGSVTDASDSSSSYGYTAYTSTDVGSSCPTTQEADIYSGDPINVSVGNVIESAQDYLGGGPFPLAFIRSYNSLPLKIPGYVNSLGSNWRGTYDSNIVAYAGDIYVYRPDGGAAKFSLVNGAYVTSSDVVSTLQALQINGQLAGWQFTTDSNTVETYDVSGRLTSITNRNGLTQTLSYNGNGRLASVTDLAGHMLQFNYDNSNRLSSLVAPDGGVIHYGYDINNNLTSITFPNGTGYSYLYENSNFPSLLTGEVDGLGVRVATWTYDTQGRAIGNYGANGVSAISVAYGQNSSTVTDVLGVTRTRQFQRIGSTNKLISMAVNCSDCESNLIRSSTYDSNGFLNSSIDFGGIQTQYTYDSRGLVLSQTVAANTALARTTTITWHPTYRVPMQIVSPGNHTLTFAYDSSGNLTKRTLTANSLSQEWTYQYNNAGQVVQIHGPRTDVVDVTTFAYDTQGNLASVTDALNKTTQFTQYDINGHLLRMIDPNGLTTTYTYDVNGRPVSTTIGTEVTAYQYDNTGQMVKLTRTDGSYDTYQYDNAHRLIMIASSLGNHIDLTLDAAGRRVKTEVYNSANNLVRTSASVANQLNRTVQTVGAAGQTTQYTYDRRGHLLTVTDPLSHTSTLSYDVLGQVTSTTDALNHTVQFSYDLEGRRTAVADARNLTTSYTFDGLNNLLQLQSPDTGSSQGTYNAAGLLVSRTDAKGQTTSYQYDALNRVIKETRADGSIVAYSYDAGVNGNGRLTGMTDPSGSTAWSYDAQGRVIQKRHVIGTASYTTQFTYNIKGQLTTMTYPSGKVVGYTYRDNGQISGLTVNGTSLISNIIYDAFGPPLSWTLGNGQTVNRNFDLDGRMTLNPIGSINYDTGDRITNAYGNTYGYDALSRLTNFSDGTTPSAYSYDANGNRIQQSSGSAVNNYAVASNSNQIQSITNGSITYNYLTDANGGVTYDGAKNYQYDVAGHMTKSTSGTYSYNGMGQRVSKVQTGATTRFVYGMDGQLIGEYNNPPTPTQPETVYLGNIPVAVLTFVGNYYIQADHLNTPRQIYNSNGKLVWKWDIATFGATMPNENPSGLGVFHYSLRYPGQYYDAETGLYYNNARYYDPKTGRYIESDPIGLVGGMNSYSYAGGNPLSRFDFYGLSSNGLPCGNTQPRHPSSNQEVASQAGINSCTVFPPPPGSKDNGAHTVENSNNTVREIISGMGSMCIEVGR